MQRNPSIWVCFFNVRCPSKWVPFLIPNTHIRAFLYWSRPPPPPPRVQYSTHPLRMSYNQAL